MAQQAGIRSPIYCTHNGLLITVSRFPPSATADINVHRSRTLEEVLHIIQYDPSTPELHQLRDLVNFQDQQSVHQLQVITTLKQELGRAYLEIKSLADNLRESQINNDVLKSQLRQLESDITTFRKRLRGADLEINCLTGNLRESEKCNEDLKSQLIRLESDITTLRQKLELADLEIDSLTNNLREYGKHNEHIQSQLGQSESANSRYNPPVSDNRHKHVKELKAKEKKMLEDEIVRLKTVIREKEIKLQEALREDT